MMNSAVPKVQAKKLFEPSNREELLRGWLLHAHKIRALQTQLNVPVDDSTMKFGQPPLEKL